MNDAPVRQCSGQYSLGLRRAGRSARRSSKTRVEMGERRGHPVETDLGEHQLEIGMPVEHAAEGHLPQRSARVDVVVQEVGEEPDRLLGHRIGVREEIRQVGAAGRARRGVVDRLHLREQRALGRAEARVHHAHQAGGLARRPERLPVRVEQRRELRVGQVAGDVRGDEAVVGRPLQLCHGGIDVVAGADRRGEMEAVGSDRERVVGPAVPRLRPGVPHLEGHGAVGRVVEQIAEPMVGVEDDFRRDPLTVHVGETQHGIVQSVPPAAVCFLEVRVARGAPARAEHGDRGRVELVVGGELRQQIVEARIEVLLPQRGRHPGVGIRGHDDEPVVHVVLRGAAGVR